MKNIATFIGIIVQNFAFTVAHLSLSKPVLWRDRDGREQTTSYLVFVQAGITGRWHFEPSNADGHQLTQDPDPFIAWKRKDIEGRLLPESSFILDMCNALGALGVQTDEASLDAFFRKPCTCGNCSESDIEESYRMYDEQKERMNAKGYIYHGDEAPKGRITKENHPENVKATSTVPAVDMPEDPFKGE